MFGSDNMILKNTIKRTDELNALKTLYSQQEVTIESLSFQMDQVLTLLKDINEKQVK